MLSGLKKSKLLDQILDKAFFPVFVLVALMIWCVSRFKKPPQPLRKR